jgi:hypothetical protein
MQILSLDQIQKQAPSVFATQPWHERSEKYRFFPTITIVEELIKNGFAPVSARQSNSRIVGKQHFTRHVLRFRHPDMMQACNVGEEIPELSLLNSHDGTSAYKLMLGMYRLVCRNGLTVKSQDINEITVRHSGRADLIGEVIEGSYKIIEETPKAIAQVEEWKQTRLNKEQQLAYAEAALVLRDTALDVQPNRLLSARRLADQSELNGNRDLWRTFNVVQENLIRGGIVGSNANQSRVTLRAVKAVDSDTKLNRALWVLTERLGQIV